MSLRVFLGKYFGKWELVLDVTPFLLVILSIKTLAHHFGFEFLELSTLFGALVTANVFLIGFMISGLLSDFKEAEKIPGEISCCAETIADECYILNKTKKSSSAKKCMHYTLDLINMVFDWFYKRVTTFQLMDKISHYNDFFSDFENESQPTYINRLKMEQNILRKLISRANSIRETNFVVAGYAIVEVITFMLIVGMIFIKITPYYESLFFVTFVSFFLIYMILFLQDLDNPFDYYERDNMIDEVSLQPLLDSKARLVSRIDQLSK